jgi:hypothetical protein
MEHTYRDSFAFASGDSTNKVISNFRVIGMAQAKYRHNYLCCVLGMLVPGHTAEPVCGSASGGCKLECLPHSKMGEVLIYLQGRTVEVSASACASTIPAGLPPGYRQLRL